MHVLLTTDTVGGVWTFTRELSAGLLEANISVTLVSFGGTPSVEQQGWADALHEHHPDRFQFHAFDIPLEWMPSNNRAFSAGEAALSRLIDHVAPDLLHANQFCFGATKGGLPRLVTAHSDVLSWADACRPHGLEPSPWLTCYRTLVQRGLDAAEVVVAPTHAMLHALGRHFHLGNQRRVIANGRTFPKAANPQPVRQLQAVTAGRLWDEAKNIALLSRIQSAVPILVAGEQQFSDHQQLSAAPSLHLTGALTESQLLELFHASAIYIAPSLYEPFGLAPLEAALCGCAILANDIPSLREVWGDAALYFHSAAELEQLLEQLATNPDLLAGAQQRAHARALTFSRDAMVQAYLNVYRELTRAAQPPLAQPATTDQPRVA